MLDGPYLQAVPPIVTVDMSVKSVAMRKTISHHVPGFLVARGYAPESRKQRSSILRRFIRHVNDPPPRDIGIADVYAWWGDLAHLEPASRSAHLTGVRLFMRHLQLLELIDSDPTATISKPTVHNADPVVLTAKELLWFIASLPNTRDRAIAALMLGSALRSSDVKNLTVENVDLAARTLRVLGKGSKWRTVPMPRATCEAVHDYLAEYPATEGVLIRQLHRDEPLRDVRRLMTDRLYEAGVKRGPKDGKSPHVLRRTSATALLESDASIRDVQEILGHEQLTSTQRYLARSNTARLLGVIDGGALAVLDQELPQAA